jgi:hypothetical protein
VELLLEPQAAMTDAATTAIMIAPARRQIPVRTCMRFLLSVTR